MVRMPYAQPFSNHHKANYRARSLFALFYFYYCFGRHCHFKWQVFFPLNYSQRPFVCITFTIINKNMVFFCASSFLLYFNLFDFLPLYNVAREHLLAFHDGTPVDLYLRQYSFFLLYSLFSGWGRGLGFRPC